MNASAVRIEPPAVPLTGLAFPAGSKSLTNRALPLAALASGLSHVPAVLNADDRHYMASASRP